MATVPLTAYQPSIYVRHSSKSHRALSQPCFMPVHASLVPRASLSLSTNAACLKPFVPVVKKRQYKGESVCFLGSEGVADIDKEAYLWKASEKAIGKFEEGQSIEGILRRQIKEKKYFDGGDGGRKPPRGGGGRGGGGNSSGGFDNGGRAETRNEILQVILATIGFVFLYIFVISGEELFLLAKDYVRYLFGRRKSARLNRAMNKWSRSYQKQNEEEYKQNLDESKSCYEQVEQILSEAE